MSDYKQIAVEGRTVGLLLACTAQFGDLAITRSECGGGWRITDRPTGFACPGMFATPRIAEGCAKEILAIVGDWRGFVAQLAQGEKPASLRGVREAIKQWGADFTAKPNSDRSILAQRVASLEPAP